MEFSQTEQERIKLHFEHSTLGEAGVQAQD